MISNNKITKQVAKSKMTQFKWRKTPSLRLLRKGVQTLEEVWVPLASKVCGVGHFSRSWHEVCLLLPLGRHFGNDWHGKTWAFCGMLRKQTTKKSDFTFQILDFQFNIMCKVSNLLESISYCQKIGNSHLWYSKNATLTMLDFTWNQFPLNYKYKVGNTENIRKLVMIKIYLHCV